MGAGLLIANINTNNQKNNDGNNLTKENLTNINNITDNATGSNANLNTNANKNTSIQANINKNANTKANTQKIGSNQSSEFTAEEAKRTVENDVSFDTEVTVYNPKYKDKDLGWLVPARDKKTGEFAGSVYVSSKHGPFVQGPEFYKDYKELISKKKF